MRRRAIQTGYPFAFGSMITLQGGNALALLLIHHVGVQAAISMRLLFGALFLAFVVRTRPRLGRSELQLVLAYGVVVAAMSGCMYEAINRLPLGVAVTVSLMGPLTVAALGSRHKLDLAWPLIALVGVILMANSGGDTGSTIEPLGLVFALANAVAWGSYIVLAARSGQRFEGVQGLAWACAVAAVLWFPAGLASGGYAALTIPLLLLAVLVGAVTSGLPFTLENLALRRMPKRVFGTLMSFEPVVATLTGFLLGQRPGPLAYGGIALVVVASVGASLPVAPNPVSVP